MEIFIDLVNRKVPIKTYKEKLGFSKKQFLDHSKNIRFYRKVVALYKEINVLLEHKGDHEKQIKALRKELKDLMGKWGNE